MTSLVLTPFTAGEAVELGNRMWRKKILPVGEVEYKGRMLQFTRDYLGRIVRAFNDRAYDQVPFQLADAQNTHTNDPERTRGEITSMELGDDGLYVTAQVTPEGEAVLAANPRLGVSARIVEDYARSDGRHFPQAIQHVLGTLDPRIPGLGAWQAIEAASPEPAMVVDLSNLSFAGDPGVIDLDWSAWDAAHGWVNYGTKDAAPEDKADRMSKNISGHSFSDGPDGREAQDAHREAAKAHRAAARLSSSPSTVAHHQKMARLHSAVASGRMESYNAEKKMDLAGDDQGFIDLDWATWDAEKGSGAGLEAHDKASATASRTAKRDAMAREMSGHDRGGSDEEKAANHLADARQAAQAGQHQTAMQHLARATQLSANPDVYAQASKLSRGVKQMAQQAGNGSAASWTTLSNEGTDDVPDLNALTTAEKERLAKLLALPDDTLNALAAGGTVLSPEELAALADPGDDGEGDLAAEIDGMSDDEIAALEAEFLAETEDQPGAPGFIPNYMPEGEPVGAGLSAEAQFSIDLANARADETSRELAVVTARLREEDYQAEKRRLADIGVPPYITELARPLLEGAGRSVELANGRTVDAGQIMRRVLAEYARQAKLLDLDVELGSPMDEPEGVADQEQTAHRDDVVSRFKSVTGLR